MNATSRNTRARRHTSPYATRTSVRLRSTGRDPDEKWTKFGATAKRQPVAIPGRRRSDRDRGRAFRSQASGAAAPVLGPGNGTSSPLGLGDERGVSRSGLFEPDILVPAQFFPSQMGGAVHKRGECQLLIAIIEDAVHCYQKYLLARTPQDRRLFDEAEQWLMRPETTLRENERPVVSFEYICAVLDLDPAFLRSGLRRWGERQLAGLGRAPLPQHAAGAMAAGA